MCVYPHWSNILWRLYDGCACFVSRSSLLLFLCFKLQAENPMSDNVGSEAQWLVLTHYGKQLPYRYIAYILYVIPCHLFRFTSRFIRTFSMDLRCRVGFQM